MICAQCREKMPGCRYWPAEPEGGDPEHVLCLHEEHRVIRCRRHRTEPAPNVRRLCHVRLHDACERESTERRWSGLAANAVAQRPDARVLCEHARTIVLEVHERDAVCGAQVDLLNQPGMGFR